MIPSSLRSDLGSAPLMQCEWQDHQLQPQSFRTWIHQTIHLTEIARLSQTVPTVLIVLHPQIYLRIQAEVVKPQLHPVEIIKKKITWTIAC